MTAKIGEQSEIKYALAFDAVDIWAAIQAFALAPYGDVHELWVGQFAQPNAWLCIAGTFRGTAYEKSLTLVWSREILKGDVPVKEADEGIWAVS